MSKRKVIPIDELYKTVGIDTPRTDSVTTTDSGLEITESVDIPKRDWEGATPNNLRYDHIAIQESISERNANQQIRNYRGAMDFLSCVDLPYGNKTTGRVKSIISKYSNIDLTEFLKQENAMIYKMFVRIIKQYVRSKYDGTTYLIGDGIGLLASVLDDYDIIKENKVRNIDLDPVGQFVFDFMFTREARKDWQFKATTEDAFHINYESHDFKCVLSDNTESPAFNERPGVIINMALSKIGRVQEWYDLITDGADQLLILVGEKETPKSKVEQSFEDIEEFDNALPMERVIALHKLEIGKRAFYIKIGYKKCTHTTTLRRFT